MAQVLNFLTQSYHYRIYKAQKVIGKAGVFPEGFLHLVYVEIFIKLLHQLHHCKAGRVYPFVSKHHRSFKEIALEQLKAVLHTLFKLLEGLHPFCKQLYRVFAQLCCYCREIFGGCGHQIHLDDVHKLVEQLMPWGIFVVVQGYPEPEGLKLLAAQPDIFIKFNVFEYFKYGLFDGKKFKHFGVKYGFGDIHETEFVPQNLLEAEIGKGAGDNRCGGLGLAFKLGCLMVACSAEQQLVADYLLLAVQDRLTPYEIAKIAFLLWHYSVLPLFLRRYD